MSGLAALLAGHNPPGLYQWHSAAHVEDVQHAAEHAGWEFAYLDGWAVEDKDSFLAAVAKCLDFPDYFGANFDAMADCLSDVNPAGKHGVLLLWDGWSPLARHDQAAFAMAQSVLRDRIGDQRACTFAVVLRGEGPALDLPELPVRHD
ncbi:MAG: barstar family protein [Nocardioidaceae bacterium]